MAITKTTENDKIEIVGDYKVVQIREITIVKEDGVEIARNFHRRSIAPTDDINSESDEVKNICAAVHTDIIKSAYQTHLENS
jgi:hypothetical protein